MAHVIGDEPSSIHLSVISTGISFRGEVSLDNIRKMTVKERQKIWEAYHDEDFSIILEKIIRRQIEQSCNSGLHYY